MATSTRGGLFPNEEDKALVRTLAEDFRLLTREQIDELFPAKSRRASALRLRRLWVAGYVSARCFRTSDGAREIGVFLGSRAWELFDDPAEKTVLMSLHREAQDVEPSQILRRLLVDWVHIRFLTASRHYPECQLLTWVDRYSPSWQSLRDYGVPVDADGYGEYLLLMHFDSVFPFFLEVDCTDGGQEARKEKIDRYIAFAASGAYERQFAAPPFRVLFVAATESQVREILRLVASGGEKLFWITTWTALKRARLFDAYWVRPGHEGRHSLLSRV